MPPGSRARWAAPSPLPFVLRPADKDNGDDKQNISRTKEIPGFIVKRKPLSTQESGFRHRTPVPCGRRERVRLGVLGSSELPAACGTSVPNFIWGAPAWLQVKKGSLPLMAFVKGVGARL